MPQPLFTIVCDFDGGTYVSQVRASDEAHALMEWAALLRLEQSIGRASEPIARSIASDGDRPVPLDGLSGVWCWTASVDRKLVLATVIRSN